jgi:hypothetical protein
VGALNTVAKAFKGNYIEVLSRRKATAVQQTLNSNNSFCAAVELLS